MIFRTNLRKSVAMTAIIVFIAGAINAQTEPNVQSGSRLPVIPRLLVIVDGQEWEGAIGSISPENIKSITILKDQDTIEPYGEKGKNGVLIITTKQKQNLTVQTFPPLLIVDGKEWEGDINSIPPESIESIEILKNESAIERYGEKGKNGVIIITKK